MMWGRRQQPQQQQQQQHATLDVERAQHVDALLRRYPARAVNPDRSVFDLPLELRDGKATALRISLPPHFPQERPTLSVLLPVVHPAVDSTGRLHTPGVSGWVYGQSALVDAVAEAVAALTSAVVDARQPGAPMGGARVQGVACCLSFWAVCPVAALSASCCALVFLTLLCCIVSCLPQQHLTSCRFCPTTTIAGTVAYPTGYPGPLTTAAAASAAAPGSPHARAAAAAAAAAGGQLPDLSRLAPAQLATLLSDDAEFKALLRGVVTGSQMAAALEDVRSRNRQLAASNLAQQGAIAEARNQLAVVRSSEYRVRSGG